MPCLTIELCSENLVQTTLRLFSEKKITAANAFDHDIIEVAEYTKSQVKDNGFRAEGGTQNCVDAMQYVYVKKVDATRSKAEELVERFANAMRHGRSSTFFLHLHIAYNIWLTWVQCCVPLKKHIPQITCKRVKRVASSASVPGQGVESGDQPEQKQRRRRKQNQDDGDVDKRLCTDPKELSLPRDARSCVLDNFLLDSSKERDGKISDSYVPLLTAP